MTFIGLRAYVFVCVFIIIIFFCSFTFSCCAVCCAQCCFDVSVHRVPHVTKSRGCVCVCCWCIAVPIAAVTSANVYVWGRSELRHRALSNKRKCQIRIGRCDCNSCINLNYRFCVFFWYAKFYFFGIKLTQTSDEIQITKIKYATPLDCCKTLRVWLHRTNFTLFRSTVNVIVAFTQANPYTRIAHSIRTKQTKRHCQNKSFRFQVRSANK